MPISRYMALAVVRCSCGLRVVPGSAVELAEAEVAVGDERAHAKLVGARQSLAVVALAVSASRGSLCAAISPKRRSA